MDNVRSKNREIFAGFWRHPAEGVNDFPKRSVVKRKIDLYGKRWKKNILRRKRCAGNAIIN